ncbi:MAG: UDP-N-acetylmuramoyl-L-alanyl-D-glutamate--2,6-diaminopimelate ligase [Candidatus Tumulicola sp.]
MASGAVDLARLLLRLPGGMRVIGEVDGRIVTGVENDSRNVQPGSLFVAIAGSENDGRAYVSQAIANGAVAVVVEGALESPLPRNVPVLGVADSRAALSTLAAAFYGDPSHALDVVGVTGTNGKTTTVHMIQAAVNRSGIPCGAIGTIGASFEQHGWTLANTTPLPPELHRILASMRDSGAKAVAMEVSSHALALGRVDDVAFRIGVLTNVARDHLDFHQTPEAYASAKRRLFNLARAAVLNTDDEHGARWAQELRDRGSAVTTYGERGGADLVPAGIVATPEGSRFSLDGKNYALRLPGRFNVLNAVAAIAVAFELGADESAIASGLAQLERIPGRMERFGDEGIDVVVDFAHTPAALEQALTALRETASAGVAVVFGCGGDRDRGKRREMGATAARLADRIYVTNDNPRSEEPRAIVDAIVAGVGNHRHVVVELDRRRAIERALSEARAGDAVLIAGKGHETYQIVGSQVLDFDDAAVARHALRLRGALR